MASVQGPFGPIVEPGWVGGAEMPGSPDLEKTFTNAWQIHAAFNAKQQALMNQAEHWANMADAQEKNSQLREREFNLNRQQDNLAHEDRIRGYEIREQKNVKDAEDKARDDKWRERKYNDMMEGKDVLASAKAQLDEENLHEGDLGYDKRWRELTGRAAQLLPNQVYAGEEARMSRGHRDNAVRTWAQFQARKKAFSEDLSKTVYDGKLEGGYDPLYSTELKPEMSGGSYIPWKSDQPTGRVLVPQPDGSTKPVASSELVRLRKELEGIRETEPKLATTTNRPDLNVYDPGKEPAPNDPKMRKEGNVYVTPDGKPHRWIHVTPTPPYGQWADP